MAMTVSGDMGIWKALSEANLRMYQYNMERGRIILQGGAAQEMQRELKRIDSVYSGKKEDEYEAQINATFVKKMALAETNSSLTNALKDIEELRLDLAELSSLAVNGATEAFDEKLKDINLRVGSSSGSLDNLSNLIGNRSRGSWTSQVKLASAGGMDIQYKSQFLGSDYQIITDDGRTLSYDAYSKSIGGADYKFGNLVIDENASTIGNGGRIVFTDSETGETVEGTLKMGGLKIGNAWMYGMQDTSSLARNISTLKGEITTLIGEETVKNLLGANSPAFADLSEDDRNLVLATLDADTVAAVQSKMADIATVQSQYDTAKLANKDVGKDVAQVVKQALKLLNKAASEYEFAGSMVTATINGYDSQMKDLQRKYDDAATETLNAKTAARKALQVKIDLIDKKFALTSTTNATLISGLFSYQNDESSKKSLFDVLKTDQYTALKNLLGQ